MPDQSPSTDPRPPLLATPHKVSIQRMEFVDYARGQREVPVKIYAPEVTGNEKLPTIIWSHGLGGSRDGAAFLGRFMAEQGFMVIHVTHRGTDTTLWEGKPGHPWDAIRNAHISRKVTLQRFQDIPFLLNELTRQSDTAPFDRIDFDRLGMSGHSFGAITTQVMAGQMLGKGRRKYSLKDDRFKCGLAYSLGPTYNDDEPVEEIYGPIALPMLYMTGTEDDSPVSGKDYKSRLPIYESATGPDQHLLILEDGDHMVFAGSRGGLKENPKRDIHEKLIQQVSLAYWHAYLNEDETAKNWLHGSEIYKLIGDEAQWRTRNL